MRTDKIIDVLLVEDDPDLGQVLSQYLQFKDISVHCCTTASEARIACETTQFRLAIIDVNLPDGNGFDLARTLKIRNAQQAFIFLTARHLPQDRLLGLELGAIDYISKPFVMQELLLKIKNFLQINKQELTAVDEGFNLQLGQILFFPNRLLLQLTSGKKEKLTKREADILKHLISSQNQLVQKNELLLTYWGNTDYFNGKSLEVFISRIRKLLKVEPRIKIENVYGVGYMLTFTE